MDIDAVENEIRDIYLWWAESAPGVTPLEHNRLGDLWRAFDALTAEQAGADDLD